MRRIQARMQGISNRELCLRAGISQSYWSEIRALKKPASTIVFAKIAGAVGATYEYRLVAQPRKLFTKRVC